MQDQPLQFVTWWQRVLEIEFSVSGAHIQPCGRRSTLEQEREQVLLDKRLTPKESKTWSHDEIAPLEVSVGIEDAEDESGGVRSQCCNACPNAAWRGNSFRQKDRLEAQTRSNPILDDAVDDWERSAPVEQSSTPEPFTERASDDSARARNGRHKVEQSKTRADDLAQQPPRGASVQRQH